MVGLSQVYKVRPELIVAVDEGPSNAVVLHEDKQYYPTAQQFTAKM